MQRVTHLSLVFSSSAHLLAPVAANNMSWTALLDMLAQADTSEGLPELPAATALAEARVMD